MVPDMLERMRPRIGAIVSLSLCLFAGVFLLSSPVGAVEDETCLDCHTDTGGYPPVMDPAAFADSVHGDFSCVDCHDTIEDEFHAEDLPPANCAACHDDVDEIYTQHGRSDVGTPHVPTCVSCHGTHDISPVSDIESRVHPRNLPVTCGGCHEDQAMLDEFGIRFRHPVRLYSDSVHGQATAGGINTAASCNDCHVTGGTSHRILPPGDSASAINHFNIPNTCGQCHGAIEQEYWAGVHGQLTARGEVDAPTCTGCHGEHGILRTDDPRSPVNPVRLAESTCSPCHEAAFLNEKYELPSGRLESFIDSYHGLKSKAGDKTVANCASCHEAHHILPATDPASSINPDRLAETCGHCHEGITRELATVPIHATATGHQTGWPYVVKIIYLVLIFAVIGGMVIHWIIDLLRQVHDIFDRESVRRMTIHEVVQHTLLAVSFTVLVVSGFSLRFHEAWWSRMLFGWETGFQVRGIIHRCSGILLLIGSVWHLVYLFTPRGKQFLKDMLPTLEDAKQAIQMMRYNLGWAKEHPHFGRFGYVEKAEYWALIWGTAVMGITGLLLWFENLAVAVFPRGVLDVCLVIHYYEAWLAFLAILVWHMYATVFNPKVYPMNPSWINGKMPRRMFEEEHPGAPIEEDE